MQGSASEPADFEEFRENFKSAEVRANDLNKGVYVHFRGEKALVEPCTTAYTLEQINGCLTKLMAAVMATSVPNEAISAATNDSPEQQATKVRKHYKKVRT